jgi:uncharacterized HAD superfamily protein
MKTEKKDIYLDLDDVICDTAVNYIQLVEQLFGKKFTFDDIHSFDLQQSFNLSIEQNSFMFAAAHQRDFTMSLQPINGAVPTLNKLKSMGYYLSIVTGRHTITYQDTLEWLTLHAVPYDRFIMVDKYKRAETDRNIAIPMETLSQMSFFLAIEDNCDMASHLSTTMDTRVKLYDRPWNRTMATGAGVERFFDWQQLEFSMNDSG